MRLLKSAIVGISLMLGSVSGAYAQNCSGQPPAYSWCGNRTALTTLPSWTNNPVAVNFTSRATNVSSAGSTTVLTVSSTRVQNLTGTLAQTFQLPDATTLVIGATFQFNNNSTGLLTVKDNGSNTIATVPAGGLGIITATAVSTANGAWDNHFWTPSNVQWASDGITISGTSSGSVKIGVAAAAGTSTLFQLPITNGSTNQVLITDGSGHTSWTNAGAGTVSSVALSMPGIFTVTGSPIVGAGTLTATLNNESANTVWAGPTTGAAAAPTFRALVGADLPNPSASTLGGIQSTVGATHQWISTISTSGVPGLTQPAFSDISGSITPSQCPTPTASTIGCVESYVAVAHQWINTISTSGVPSSTQPDFSDLTGQATLAQLPTISNGSVLSNISGGSATPLANSLTSVIDSVFGATQGQVLYRSGTVWTALNPGTSGQVLTTNGAAANPSWTSVSGTGTVTSIATNNGVTGGTITTSGTIGLASISTGNVLGNVSGISAAPTATTPTQVLDVIGSTQGSVLYRGASVWSALTPGTNGQFLQTTGAGSTPQWAAAVTSITPGGGQVSSVTASCSQSAITASGTISAARCPNAQTGTTYAIVDGDRGKLVTFSNVSATAVSIAQAGAASAFQSGWVTFLKNENTGVVTITPTTSTIDGSATFTLSRGDYIALVSDGTNYKVIQSRQCCTHLSQVYTASTTYTPPPGVYFVLTKVWGGGGGSCGTAASVAGSGGGGGGYSEQTVAVVPGSGVTVTVGAAGTAGSSTGPTAGGNGGQSAFGSVTANGGIGTVACTAGTQGGAGGTANGTFNVSGGAGGNNNTVALGATQIGGQGGAAYGTPLTQAGNVGNAPGSGGGGSVVGSANGFAGAIGRVVVYD